ncbi:hypothetical protein Tco_1213691 [Tanacetum coccineum]
MNKKNYSFDLETFKDMLQIYPSLPRQKFVDPPFEEEIIAIIRELGYSGNVMSLSDIKVDTLPQPWRTFDTIINKCLSGGSKIKVCTEIHQEKTKQSPKASPGKRLKAIAKVTKSGKKKQPAEGLDTLSKIALSEVEQMKLATKRSKTQLHSSYASGSGKSSNEKDDEVNVSKDDDDDENNDQDDVDEQTELDNDGDDFVHPKFFTHDDKERQDEEVNEEDSFDPRVHTPSHVKSTDDEESDEEIQGKNVDGEEMEEEETNKDKKVNELHRDVNVNLEGRDTEMTYAPRTIIQTTQVIEDTHVIITPVNPKGQQQSSSVSSGFVSNMLNPSPDTGIDSIFNLNNESTSLVDVLITAIAEIPLSSATTLPPPPIPLITHFQQTPVPTLATVPSSSLQDLPNFVSVTLNHFTSLSCC